MKEQKLNNKQWYLLSEMGQTLVFILPLHSDNATDIQTPSHPVACQVICVHKQEHKHFRSFLNRNLVQQVAVINDAMPTTSCYWRD